MAVWRNKLFLKKQKGKKQKRYVDNSRNNYKPLFIELYFSNTKNFNVISREVSKFSKKFPDLLSTYVLLVEKFLFVQKFQEFWKFANEFKFLSIFHFVLGEYTLIGDRSRNFSKNFGNSWKWRQILKNFIYLPILTCNVKSAIFLGVLNHFFNSFS